MLQLDDDISNPFLHFSRKVIEASSTKRPVDIQLGIASGKEFNLFKPKRTPSMKSDMKRKTSLDLLVEDVLKHIEACPNQTAYSDVLDKLTPRLKEHKKRAIPIRAR
ncbi:hypothetical protein G6F57_008353 [Rhizopus arrhizus]|uniref:Uncharacterized protein n=1 Tax=Rhizopus oryzae TaxID=64495 RepID=A0A9P7BQH3_RHIOR|nr:hypothetical protein G6F23_009701 [Rhizopus arrhizus]KAG1418650.1 hypothetical protein G6F58_004972 [Rhizopus delemar]KAG0760383.1 hypothetical protein G6F24_008358 [Rhizopus arrhizus]KAG0773723.1 hypothetical protein G6F22_014633 [Rhizopus arrhizus]KAG0789734.1 hypothetical protein G6F21_006311 [Rhizopus arrhizus]